MVLLGLLVGCAVWTNELALLLLVPMPFLAFRARTIRWQHLLLAASGAALGYLPRILYNVWSDLRGFRFLAGILSQVSESELREHGLRRLLQPAWEPEKLLQQAEAISTGLGIPLLALVLSVGLIALFMWRRGRTRIPADRFVVGLAASILLTLAVARAPRYASVAIPYSALLVGILGSALAPRWLRSPKVIGGVVLFFGLFSLGWSSKAWVREDAAAETALTRFLQESGYRRGISGHRIAQKVMYYSRGEIAVSLSGAPPFKARLLDAERRLWRHGAEFVVYDSETGSDRIEILERYLIDEGLDWKLHTIDGRLAVYHRFSRPLRPGEFLPEAEQPLFRRHAPWSRQMIREERANRLLGAPRRHE